MPTLSISALMKLLGIDPDAGKKQQALGVLNQLAGDELGYAGLELSPDGSSYVNKKRDPLFHFTPKQEMLALGSQWGETSPLLRQEKMRPVTSQQERLLMGNDWQSTRPAPLSEDQEHSRRMLRFLSAMKDIDPSATAGIAAEFFNPVGRKDRESKLSYRDAMTANAFAGLEGGGDGLSWDEYKDASPEIQRLHDRFGGLNTPRTPQNIRLLELRREAEAKGDTAEVDRIDAILARLDKIEGPAGSTLVRDRGTGDVEPVTTPEQMLEGLGGEVTTKEQAKLDVEYAAEWPGTEAVLDHSIGTVDRILNTDPDVLKAASGFFGPITGAIWGTPTHDVHKLLETVQGQAFINSIQNVARSIAPVSDRDATALINAAVNVSGSQTYDQLIENLKLYQDVLRRAGRILGGKAKIGEDRLKKYEPGSAITPSSTTGDAIPRYDRQGRRLN